MLHTMYDLLNHEKHAVWDLNMLWFNKFGVMQKYNLGH